MDRPRARRIPSAAEFDVELVADFAGAASGRASWLTPGVELVAANNNAETAATRQPKLASLGWRA